MYELQAEIVRQLLCPQGNAQRRAGAVRLKSRRNAMDWDGMDGRCRDMVFLDPTQPMCYLIAPPCVTYPVPRCLRSTALRTT